MDVSQGLSINDIEQPQIHSKENDTVQVCMGKKYGKLYICNERFNQVDQ